MITIGILGAGQLAQLLAHSAYQLGMKTICYAENLDQPAARLSKIFVGSLDDPDALQLFAQQCDVITVENENISSKTLAILEQTTPVYPKPNAITSAQDRLLEKKLFKSLQIDTPSFAAVNSLTELEQALKDLGTPALLKIRRYGYDGKGQFLLRDATHAKVAWQAIGSHASILEGYISFDYEVSIIAARSKAGQCVFYPLIKNTHRDGILRISESPINEPALQQQAEAMIQKILEHFDYVGVLALELFVKDGKLIANELAPRVHNSGHLTLESCSCSQFENQLRAVADLPLQQPKIYGYTQMLNILGTWPKLPPSLKANGHIYYYGKTPRPARKLGHITLFGAEPEIIKQDSDAIRKLL